MNLVFIGIWMCIYGFYCDFLLRLLDKICEFRIKKQKSLNKRLLIKISNLSNKNLLKWQKKEQKFIRLLMNRQASE